MPEKIIKKFQRQYGKKKGKEVFNATANKQDRNPETFKMNESKKEKPEMIPLDRAGNKHLPPSRKRIPSKVEKAKKDKKKWKKDLKNLTESNSYIRKVSRENYLSEKVLDKYWNFCVVQESKAQKFKKSDKKFWESVRRKFDGMLKSDKLNETKMIVEAKTKQIMATENFLTSLVTKNYVEAKQHLQVMIESAFQASLDKKRNEYMKEIAEKVNKQIKEI